MTKPSKKRQVIESMDVILNVPTSEEWFISRRAFRNELRIMYARGEKGYKNDSSLCRAHGINRSQFSRTMNGSERPSHKIMEVLAKMFPDIYQRESITWAKEVPETNITLHHHYEMLIDQQRKVIEVLIQCLEKGLVGNSE